MPIWNKDSVTNAPKIVYTPDDAEAAQCSEITYDPTGSVPLWCIKAEHISGKSAVEDVEAMMEDSGGLEGI